MKKLTTVILVLLAILIPLATRLPGEANAGTKVEKQVENVSSFEQAVRIIKKYETLHSARHWPLIGYGHKVMPGEKYSRGKALSEKEADALLRKDLLKNCALFREYGKDSLLLGVLAYNIGPGAAAKSSVAKKLKSGNRDIKESYLSHCRYRGKVLSGLKRRRVEEFEALYVHDGKVEEIEVDTQSVNKETLAHEKHGTENEGGLFASIFSPVRLMLGALSNPFRMATESLASNNEISETLNQPVFNEACISSI